MPKDIVLKDVPDEQYWEWKREKSESEANNWVEFFADKVGDSDGA